MFLIEREKWKTMFLLEREKEILALEYIESVLCTELLFLRELSPCKSLASFK